MARAPKGRVLKSNKPTPATNKTASDGRGKGKKSTKIKAGAKKSRPRLDPFPVPVPPPPAPVDSCCAACDAIPTGHVGVPWRDAAGTWHCLDYDPTVGPKRVGIDGSGLFLANP